MFSHFMAKYPFKAIANCPGRFCLRGVHGISSIADLGSSFAWEKLPDGCSRDVCFVTEFEDKTGGLIVFEKRDKALIVTLSNASGFARKMAMLRTPLQSFRRVGASKDNDNDVVLLMVLTRTDVFAHEGTGLIADRRNIPSSRQFVVDEGTLLSEAEHEIVPMLGKSLDDWSLRRMDSTSIFPLYWILKEETHCLVTLKSMSRSYMGVRIAFAYLDEKKNCAQTFVVKEFNGVSLRVVKICETLAEDEVEVEEISEVYFGRFSGGGIGGMVVRGSELQLGSVISPEEMGDVFDEWRHLVSARLLLCCLAKRRADRRGDFFKLLNGDVIRLIAKRYLSWSHDWKTALGKYAKFEFWFGTMNLVWHLVHGKVPSSSAIAKSVMKISDPLEETEILNSIEVLLKNDPVSKKLAKV